MSSSFKQRATGPMTYPAKGTFNRFLFKTPLIWWRMGLGPILGHQMLVVTTWGRKSRLPRHTMVSYTKLDSVVYLLSGWGERTDWVQNVSADPHVTVQLGNRTYSALARRVVDVEEYRAMMEQVLRTGGDSHFIPWLQSLDIAHDINDLIAKRDRVTMVALDPTDEPGPPPMPVDLKWVWAVMLTSFAVGWLLGGLSNRARSSRSAPH